MKLLIIILLSFFVTSCATQKSKHLNGKSLNKEKTHLNDVKSDTTSIDQTLDTDGDGVIDIYDHCPKIYGLVSNGGCPEIVMNAPKTLRFNFNLVLVKDFEDFLTKNPQINDDTKEHIKYVFDNSGVRSYNLEILYEMNHEGIISNDEFKLYVEKLSKGESYFEIKSSKIDKSNYIPNVENMDIVDNTNDNSSKGTIAYSVPNEIQVGKQYVIKLRITKEKGKEVNKTLVLGDRNIPISDTSIESKITIENIRVEKTMTAELISEDGNFKVTPQNTNKQVIEDNEYTEWGWLITPTKSGKTYLKLIIKIKVDVDGEVSYKDIVVFDKNIEVKANTKLEVKSWFGQYWQWLMTTIIIPLFVWFFKRKKKED